MVVEWIFEGEPEKDSGLTYYKRVRARFTTGLSTRVFRIGECVRVDTGDPSQEWIAQIVELFDEGPSSESKSIRQRVTLRWLYHPKDIAFWYPDERNGMYFSEHIDVNAVEVIAGRAFLFDSEQEIKAFKKQIKDGNRPNNFWPRDQLVLVQYYFQNGQPAPPPVRRLDNGELKFLLDNPSAEPMYHSFRNVRRNKSSTGSSANTKSVVPLKSAPTSPSKRKPISMPDKLTEIKVTDAGRARSSSSKNTNLRAELSTRRNRALKETRTVKLSEHLQNSASKQTPSEHLTKRRENENSKRGETQAEKSPLPAIPRKRGESNDNYSGSPTSKASKSPSNQIIIEKDERNNSMIDKHQVAEDLFSLRRRNRPRNEATASVVSEQRKVNRMPKPIEKMEIDSEFANNMEDNDDAMEVESPLQSDELYNDDVLGQLVSSFEQLSDKQKRYAFKNLEAHVELISNKLGERGLDLNTMDDEQKNAFANELTKELIEH